MGKIMVGVERETRGPRLFPGVFFGAVALACVGVLVRVGFLIVGA